MLKQELTKLYFKFGGYIYKCFPSILSHQLPRTLIVEATNQCMLKCRVCATVNDSTRPKGKMSRELFISILNQLDWNVRRINFSYAGEPLLNEDIFYMVKSASEQGIPSIIETNGMLLKKYVDEILDSDLSIIKVAFDGVTQESASKYREGINLSTVIAGVKDLVVKRNKLGLTKLEIHLQFIVMKHNEGEMKRAIEIAREIGVDFIDFKSMILSGGIWLGENEKNRFALEFLPQGDEFKRYHVENGNWKLKNNLTGFCPTIISGMVIMWNGDVTICTMDVDGRFVVGNIIEKPLKTIWKNNKYAELRKKALRREIDECKECAYLFNHFTSHKI